MLLCSKETIRALPLPKRREVVKAIGRFTLPEQEAFYSSWYYLARAKQLPPLDHFTWKRGVVPSDPLDGMVMMAGRAIGKTRVISETLHMAREYGLTSMGMMSRTSASLRRDMVEGKSGVLTTRWPGEVIEYKPATAGGMIIYRATERLPYETRIYLATAMQPDAARGGRFQFAVLDEIASYPNFDEVLDVYMPCIAEPGTPGVPWIPWWLAGTTPKPHAWLKEMVVNPRIHVVKGSSRENAENISLGLMERRLGSGKMAQQELHGEIVDNDGQAMFDLTMIESSRARYFKTGDGERLGYLDEYNEESFSIFGAPIIRVLGVDPAVTNSLESDAHGLVIVALYPGDHVVVEHDYTAKMDIGILYDHILALCQFHDIDRVVVEVNQGGAAWKDALMTRNARRGPDGVMRQRVAIAIEEVHATHTGPSIDGTKNAKMIRAEPVRMMMTESKVHHWPSFAEEEPRPTLGGKDTSLKTLEEQQCGYLPKSTKSPNNFDAYVYAVLSALGMLKIKQPKTGGRIKRQSVPGTRDPFKGLRRR